MFVSKDKKTAINTDHVGSAHVTENDAVVLSIGANAATFEPGDDAKALASEFGLTTHADDAAAEAKKEKHDAANQAQAHQAQSVKK